MLDHVARDLLFKFFHELRPLRSRTHKAHIPFKHVKELGHLIYVEPPYDPSHGSDPRVSLGGPSGELILRPLYIHGPELEHTKRPVMQAYPFLGIYYRTGARKLD